jgi:TRAP-type C4-dicarboxylate transport system permease small subunit
MVRLLNGIDRAITWLCALLAIVIIGALSTQIISRYVFNAPVHMTDDLAEVALVWMTFLGAASLYRSRAHISVDLVQAAPRPWVRRGARMLIHLLVIPALALVLYQVHALQPLMGRLDFGTLPKTPLTTKFALVLLPFGLGAGVTIVFAVEALVGEVRGLLAGKENEPWKP